MGVKGGERLAKYLRQVQRQSARVQNVKTEIGYFGRVAPLAYAHEYGRRDKAGARVVPARPAFGRSLHDLRREYRDTLRREAKGSLGLVTLPMLEDAARAGLGAVRESYLDAPGPELSERQQERKAGTPGEGRKLVGSEGTRMIDHLRAEVNGRKV